MAKRLDINLSNIDEMLKVANALDNPARLRILTVINNRSMSVSEIASELHIPQSTVTMHIKCLEEAGLINTEAKPGDHGTRKVCSRKKDIIEIKLAWTNRAVENDAYSTSMPVGAFTDSEIHETCGMCCPDDILEEVEDYPGGFYTTKRFQAGLIWSSYGYLEYTFPIPADKSGFIPKQIIFSFEACSEAPNYNEKWPSDLTIWINDVEAASWQCPGDFGARRGRLSPAWWNIGATQYGLLYTLEITNEGTFLNREKQGYNTIFDYNIQDVKQGLRIRIGNKEDAVHKGGFNLFGRSFGDYEQDLILTMIYPCSEDA